MTDCSTYIGDLDDPEFEWDEGNWNGNIPSRLSSDFPPTRKPYHRDFHEWVDKIGVICKQTDFSGWVARVNKSQLIDFLHYCYTIDDNDVKSLIVFVGTLEDGKEYALVAEEY